jgi:hypothetical protein
MVDVEGNIRDLSAYVDDVTPGELGPNVLEELAALDPVLLRGSTITPATAHPSRDRGSLL